MDQFGFYRNISGKKTGAIYSYLIFENDCVYVQSCFHEIWVIITNTKGYYSTCSSCFCSCMHRLPFSMNSTFSSYLLISSGQRNLFFDIKGFYVQLVQINKFDFFDILNIHSR